MPAIVLTLLQALLLLLLYVFVGRAVRAIVRDMARPQPVRPARPPRRARSAPAPGAAEQEPRVVPGQLVVHTPGGRPQVVELDAKPVTFGRAGGVTVRLDDPYVSDRHARVHRDGGTWVVTDLDSTNGTFVNQVKVRGSSPLAAGDQLGVGRTVVEVRR